MYCERAVNIMQANLAVFYSAYPAGRHIKKANKYDICYEKIWKT